MIKAIEATSTDGLNTKLEEIVKDYCVKVLLQSMLLDRSMLEVKYIC